MEANLTIKILDARTRTNSLPKGSRIIGSEIVLGKIVLERADGKFFENVKIDGKEFRPFYCFATEKLELSPMNMKQKTIVVESFGMVPDNTTVSPIPGQTWKTDSTAREFLIIELNEDGTFNCQYTDDWSSQGRWSMGKNWFDGTSGYSFVSAKRTFTSFKIQHGSGTINGKHGQHSFDTAEEAANEAREFKNDPYCHNSNMEDSSVEYWKKQNFVIIEVTSTTRFLELI